MRTSPIILIAGKNGQVGWDLKRSLTFLGSVEALDRNEMDLSNPDSIRNKIHEIQPDIIVNAAAYTAVDKAEEEELATIINGTLVGVIAGETRKLKAFSHSLLYRLCLRWSEAGALYRRGYSELRQPKGVILTGH